MSKCLTLIFAYKDRKIFLYILNFCKFFYTEEDKSSYSHLDNKKFENIEDHKYVTNLGRQCYLIYIVI